MVNVSFRIALHFSGSLQPHEPQDEFDEFKEYRCSADVEKQHPVVAGEIQDHGGKCPDHE